MFIHMLDAVGNLSGAGQQQNRDIRLELPDLPRQFCSLDSIQEVIDYHQLDGLRLKSVQSRFRLAHGNYLVITQLEYKLANCPASDIIVDQKNRVFFCGARQDSPIQSGNPYFAYRPRLWIA